MRRLFACITYLPLRYFNLFAVVRQNVKPRARRDEILEMAALRGIVDDAEWLV